MPSERWPGLFGDAPTARRQLLLILYAVVGPVFTAVLFFEERPAGAWSATALVAALIAAGAAWLWVRRSPGTLDWLFPMSFVPTVCCGIALVATGAEGPGFLGVLGAPLAWSAVLLDAPVVWATLVVALGTCFTAVALLHGPVAGLASSLLFGTMFGLVAWVVHGTARALRVARRQIGEAGKRERFLSALVDSMADGIIVADGELDVVEYTGQAERIYGWTRDEVLGRNLDRDFRSEFPDGDVEAVRRGLAEGGLVRARMRALRKDGTWADLDLSATALRDAAGAVVGWLSVARDIGPQVAAERAVRDALAQNERTLAELREALQKVKTLSGLLPICMHCHRIQDDSGSWARLEVYVTKRSEATFTHGLCPDCERTYYPARGG